MPSMCVLVDESILDRIVGIVVADQDKWHVDWVGVVPFGDGVVVWGRFLA